MQRKHAGRDARADPIVETFGARGADVEREKQATLFAEMPDSTLPQIMALLEPVPGPAGRLCRDTRVHPRLIERKLASSTYRSKCSRRIRGR